MTHEVNLILLDILAQVPNFRKDQGKNVFGFSLGIHQKNQERIESVRISSVPKQTLADRAVAEDRLDQQRAIDDARLGMHAGFDRCFAKTGTRCAPLAT